MFFRKKVKTDLAQLQKAFQAQKQTLMSQGIPELFGKELFEKELELLWEKIAGNTQPHYGFGQIPLLLVVNFPEIQKGIESIKGHSELPLNAITTHIDKNVLFYALLDVEDGKTMVAKSAQEAVKKFGKEQRFAVNINESIALLTHYPHILKDHYLICAGSSFNKDGKELPLLWLLSEHNNPELHYAWIDIAHGNYGAGSYSIKV